MKGAFKYIKYCTFLLIMVAAISALAPEAGARTDVFFVAPQSVVAEPGQEATLTIYVKAERLRAFGFTLLLDTRYITFVPNSLLNTELTNDFDFIGANLIEDEVYDENRPYLKELRIGGSVLEPVSSVWDDGEEKHGVAALATFKIRLVDGFSMPPEGYLLIPVAVEKTVNDFVNYRQGGGILFFKQPGESPPQVKITSPRLEERIDDANVTLMGEVTVAEGQTIGQVMWIDPFKIQDPSPGNFILGQDTTITVDFSEESPTIQTVFFAAIDTNQNGASTGTIFGINEDVIVEFEGEIKGIVRNATLLEPIAGAEVILYERTGGELRRIKSVYSGSQGDFYIDNVGRGSYTLIAHKEGFQEGAQDVYLETDNSTVEGVVIELFPLGRPTGDVYTYTTGTFCVTYHSSGDAAIGFKVEDITGLYSCITVNDGCCQIDGLRKGEDFHYIWHATGEDGYSLASTPQAVPEDGEIRLEVQSRTLTTLEIHVLDPVTMLGVEGVYITIKDQETSTTISTDGPTGPSGGLEFFDLEPGKLYTIDATLKSGNLTHEVSEELVLEEGDNQVTIYLHSFDQDAINNDQGGGARLVLQVLDGTTLRPMDIAPQKIELVDSQGGSVVVKSKDDHYEASGLGEGNYTLSLNVPGYLPVDGYTFTIDGSANQGLIVYLYTDSEPKFFLQTIGQIGEGSLQGLLLSMTTLEPVWNVLVTIYDSTGNTVAETRTNAIGQFEIRDLSPGEYEITAKADGYQWVTYKVVLSPGEEKQLTLRLFPVVHPDVTVSTSSNATSILHGVVLSSELDFSPTPLIRAKVRGVSMVDGTLLFEKFTDSAGNFVVHSGLGEEPFKLEIEASGYENRTVGPIQLAPKTILFKPIYMVPSGAMIRFSSGGSGGEVAQFIPEDKRLFLFNQDRMFLATLDDTYKVVRTIDSINTSGVPQKSVLTFGPAGLGSGGIFSLAYTYGTQLEISAFERTFGRLGGDTFGMTFPKDIMSLSFRYPLLFVANDAGLTALELYNFSSGLGPSSPGMPRILWHLQSVKPALTFTHKDGLIAVGKDGLGYFVDTLTPNVPVVRDEWNLLISPTNGMIGGEYGIFCDTSGILVPVKQGESRGYFVRGRDYNFSSFKKALVFTIAHPLSGYEGKEMALALILEDGWLNLMELTDLNLWLLRRYPISEIKDIFTSKVWREYTMGQDRYEGAVYLVGPSGISAIAMPKYLGQSNTLTVTWDSDSVRGKYLFTDKGYLFDLDTLGQGEVISFDAEPGTYDVYMVDEAGRTRVANSISSFGGGVADFRSTVSVDIETISYPGGPTRVFHGGEEMGVSLTLKPKEPLVVDGYLLTSINMNGATYYYYWLQGTDGAMYAYPYGPDLNIVPPQPLVKGLYLGNNLATSFELVTLPQEVTSLSGKMSFILLPTGASFDENATLEALGMDELNFSISDR